MWSNWITEDLNNMPKVLWLANYSYRLAPEFMLLTTIWFCLLKLGLSRYILVKGQNKKQITCKWKIIKQVAGLAIITETKGKVLERKITFNFELYCKSEGNIRTFQTNKNVGHLLLSSTHQTSPQNKKHVFQVEGSMVLRWPKAYF